MKRRKKFSGSYKAYRARIARDNDTSVVKSKAYSKLRGGPSTDTNSVMDTCCMFPVMTTALVEGIGAEVKPCSGGSKNLLGSVDQLVEVMVRAIMQVTTYIWVK